MWAGLDRSYHFLRLRDLGKLPRRRKAFEGGRKNGVGLRGSRGRLVEFRKRECRDQFVAAGLLLLRDSDRGPMGFFGRRGIVGIALQQDVAAKAMQEEVGVALPSLFRDRQPRTDTGECAVEIPVAASISPSSPK